MHRTIEITVPSNYSDTLIQELEQLDQVISMSIDRNTSIKPEGDVLTVHVLNRGADQVMSLVEAAREHGQVSITTSDVGSIVDPEQEQKVANDIDEVLWEEVETNLRHQSRIRANFLVLMALGGIVSTAGFITGSESEQAISFVAAVIIAPGFEPLAKIPIGLALRRWGVIGDGLTSVGVGYLALLISAAVIFLVLRLAGVAMVDSFVHNTEVESLAHPTLREILQSGCGAVAGMIMLLSDRSYLIPGALVALTVIESAAMVGVALAASRWMLAFQGAERFGIDVLLIVVGGVIVVLLKQAIVHRRNPIV